MTRTQKWDNPVPRSKEKCLEVAKCAAAKVCSRLLAEGKIQPSQENHEAPKIRLKKVEPEVMTVTNENPFSCDIEINDISYACRNLLTKSVTQEDILKASGAKVATRGRFMSQEEKLVARANGERPLYLSIQGPNQQSVDVAVQRISNIINSMCGTPLSSLSISSFTTSIKSIMSNVALASNSSTTLAFVQDKLFVGLEHAPLSFDVKLKILGPSGSYLQHIQSETGAKAMLRGRGSGFIEPTSGREAFEPMYIYIQHGNHVGLQQAKHLAQNLLETVRKEYADFQQALALAPPSINPGTASMLAGLQQPAYPPSNMMWNNPVPLPPANYTAGFTYHNPESSPSSSFTPCPIGSSNYPMMPGSMPQQPYSPLGMYPSFNGAPMLMKPPSFVPALPVMPVLTQTQISSVSAAQNYYEQYLSAPSSTGMAADRSVSRGEKDGTLETVGRSSPPGSERQGFHRRRFQEKLEDTDKKDEDGFNTEPEYQQHETPGKSMSPPISSPSVKATSVNDATNKDHKNSTRSSKSSSSLEKPSKDSNYQDRTTMPPPPQTLKRKRTDTAEIAKEEKKSAREGNSFKIPMQPKGVLPGALKSVAACYGSDDEDDRETKD